MCAPCIPTSSKCAPIKTPSLPKMTYKPVVCEKPKFAENTPCCSEEPEEDPFDFTCPKKVIPDSNTCPRPLPQPPTDPVFLCPCPRPPKLKPGPCPSLKIKEFVPRPPRMCCLFKEQKLLCPNKTYYCPPDGACCADQKPPKPCLADFNRNTCNKK